ncbi:MAG: HAMP domain-containing sensor histidine kinase [Candidatus Omnitrophota bacterium]|nr:HAMP domain-containing sensor histidine kinase [Candidatus Omnitrophota bacterium]
MMKFKRLEGLVERLYWLIRLRWIAVIAVCFTVLLTRYIFSFSLPALHLYIVAATLGMYNLAFLLLLRLIKGKESLSVINKIANAQISLDLLSLAVLIHFSGGIENPFLFYFVFHMIIASILLNRRNSFLQATFAILLFSTVVVLEYFGILHHYCLKNFIVHDQQRNLIYISGISFVFISTLYIAVYMATSISMRLRQREKVLEEANLQLEEKDRIKSEYVLRVTHGIKEHLSAIQGCLEPVSGGITGELNPKQFDLVRRAAHRTSKLMFFVRALLQITRIKLSKNILMEDFPLEDIISEAITAASSKAKDKNIAINLTVEAGIDKIKAAREYIQETLTNLIVNSVKYTPRNGKIDIMVWNKGSSILIEIIDTGIGIPKNELPRVFEEFYRASNAKETEKDGTGLGLSIAKQVIEMHDGKIWAESEEGKGSKFSIELPKRKDFYGKREDNGRV